MTLSYRKRLILLKPETVYGTDPAPAAADALLCRGLDLRPLEGEYRDRELVTGQLGQQPERLANIHARATFQVEAGGASAAGTAPTWGQAMRACGYAETIAPGTSVTYNLVSSGYESAAMATHIGGADGHKQLILGARGTVGFTAKANDLPYFSFDMQGIFAAPAKTAPPATDYSAHVAPLVAEPPNVSVFTIGGAALCFTELEITGGHRIRTNRYANCAEITMGDRAYTGRVTCRMPALNAKDLIAEAKAGTLQALAFTIGDTAGNILSLTAPKVQLKFEGYQDAEGDLDVTLGLNFTPDAGDDELAWALT